MTTRLEMKNMTKMYGSFIANDSISLSLKAGEIHAVVGENGAGKTTLMRMLYGMEQPTSGEIFIDGKRVTFANPNDAIKNRIGMVHQHFMLFPDFTAAENIVIGHEPKKAGFFNRKKATELVQELVETYQIPVRPNAKTANCSIGEQQRIEILKVLYQGADIIILDEPSAVLTPIEVKGLLKTIRQLADQGKSIILITHKLREVMEVADSITVLRNGKVTGNVTKEQTSVAELAKLMVGRELHDLTERVQMNGEAILEIKNVTVQEKENKPLLDDISLTVNRGEIVGLAGVSGNGQSELLQVISGLRSVKKGSILLDGKDMTNQSVLSIRDTGLSHIPEDRYLWGAAKQATVEETGLMGYHKKPQYRSYSFLRKAPFRKLVNSWIEKFEIKAGSLEEKAGNLSGGNLQKLIVARELGQETPILIAAEPTRGVDIGAMEYIHEALIEKRNKGEAVLLVSSELSEIMALSDRVLVMYEGEIAGEMDRQNATEEAISVLMAGGNHHESKN
ncbi:ABC transporter ATP-binding protein [Metabacillus halosaccharovorans]|uniref:ABC transporter ATP-binding protein n=1 Tax=Metabacillus halosaccharovorans TaxID=930124 RepID=UPI001C1F6F4B|nr:ABC transporter ATP-binding protein [Metabacillus halosaccharovorans]MBU7594240.1 ABC transporter ATP-binding protein [Metabacillus halosaccharovorans]